MQSEIPEEIMMHAERLYDEGGYKTVPQIIAEAIMAERSALEAALSAAEPVGYLVTRGDVAGPDNEYYSFCEDQGSAAAEADIYDKGYFPIYAAPPAPSVAVKALQAAEEELSRIDCIPMVTETTDTYAQLELAKVYAGRGAHEARKALSALSAQVQDVASSGGPERMLIVARARQQLPKRSEG